MGGEQRLALGALTVGTVNLAKVGLQLILLPIMARLLGPGEFGVYALALPTVLLVSLFVDGGLGSTLSREPEEAALVWSSAFWLLLLTGGLVALATSLFGFVLGHWIVRQPRLPGMIGLLSLSLIFQVLGVSPIARLTRRRNLGLPALADLAGNLLGAAVTITLGLWGAGAWSLVFQYLTISIVRSLIVNLAAFELPKLRFQFAAVKPHLVSGGLLVGSRLVEYGGRITENVGFERAFGTHLLGIFTFGNQISKFVVEALSNVTWSTLYVQALTGEAAQVRELHRKLSRLLAAVLFPASALAMVVAPELISLLLGPNWSDLPFLLRLALPASVLPAIASQFGALLLARDRIIIQFWCSSVMAVARVALIFAAPWIGLHGTMYGLLAVSLGYFVAMLALSGASMGYALRPLMRGFVGPLVSSGVGAAVCWSILDAGAAAPAMTSLSLAAGCVAFLVSMLAIDRKSLIEDWDAALRLVGRSRSSRLSLVGRRAEVNPLSEKSADQAPQ